MPDNVNNSEPVRKPARSFIPPFKTIIEEGNQEIKRQADALVELTLDSKNAVDPKSLSKWGEDGTRYFFRRLKTRVSEQVGAAAATRVIPSDSNVAVSAGHSTLSAMAPALSAVTRAAVKPPLKATTSQRAKVPVVAVKNWKSKQHYRFSYVAAATMLGLLHAVIMTVVAIILLRLMA
jgi:hypothetical protein